MYSTSGALFLKGHQKAGLRALGRRDSPVAAAVTFLNLSPAQMALHFGELVLEGNSWVGSVVQTETVLLPPGHSQNQGEPQSISPQ